MPGQPHSQVHHHQQGDAARQPGEEVLKDPGEDGNPNHQEGNATKNLELAFWGSRIRISEQALHQPISQRLDTLEGRGIRQRLSRIAPTAAKEGLETRCQENKDRAFPQCRKSSEQEHEQEREEVAPRVGTEQPPDRTNIRFHGPGIILEPCQGIQQWAKLARIQDQIRTGTVPALWISNPVDLDTHKVQRRTRRNLQGYSGPTLLGARARRALILGGSISPGCSSSSQDGASLGLAEGRRRDVIEPT